MRALLVVLAGAALLPAVFATSPKLNSLTPPGAQRGSEVELKLYGSRLDSSPELVFVEPGITVAKIEGKTNQVTARLQVAPDCRLGEHQLRIRTANGVSELRTFWVGAWTNVAEAETNNSQVTSQQVPLGVTVNGRAGGDDVDFFRVDAKKGQRVSAEVEAIRLARAMLDPFLSIRDADGRVLASADDTTLLAQDAFVSVEAPRDGAYYIELRDSTYSGNGSLDYRLHIGAFARPAVAYPMGGKAGEKVSFQFIEESGSNFTQAVTLPSSEQEEKFGILGEHAGAISPSPNWVRVTSFRNVLESEPNDTRENATVHGGELPIAFNGILSQKGETDWFRFSAKKGQALEVSVFARRLRSPVDSLIEIVDAKGNSVASNEDGPGAGTDSIAKFTAAADGEYAVRIRDQFRSGGPSFTYRIEVTPQSPSVTLSIPEVARNDSQSRQYINVPRGSRFATMILAKRANFAGDLTFAAPDLPTGVKLSAETLLAKLEQQPLVFEAAADAPITGKYVELLAKPAETGKTLTSRYRHNLDFISGPNNTFYYSTVEPKLYVAVCEEAPYTLRIEEPKVPLVQYGALDLRIVAERKAGFDEPINVKMLWNPPGVSSLPDITIPKGTNVAVYQLNAKPDAELRKWKLAVLGTATVKGGPVHVSSQLATLEVAEPFVIGAMQPVRVSPGQETNLICKLDQKKPFEGKARLRVLGLPENITASDAEITSADKEVVIKLKVGEKVPFASYRNFICTAEVLQKGEVVPHNLAAGAVIRVVPPPKEETGKQVARK